MTLKHWLAAGMAVGILATRLMAGGLILNNGGGGGTTVGTNTGVSLVLSNSSSVKFNDLGGSPDVVQAVVDPSVTNSAILFGPNGSNIVANALTNGAGLTTYIGSNTYFVISSFASTNRVTQQDWSDITALYMSYSADGTNVLPVAGETASSGLGVQGTAGINDPTCWSGTNGNLLFTWTTNPDAATNVLNIYSTNSFGAAPTFLTNMDFSALAIGGLVSNEWIFAPEADATPGAVVSNLFLAISTNNLATKEIYILTCTNVPAYTGWNAPVLINCTNNSAFDLHIKDDPCGFSYQGTNYLLFASRSSLLLATNTTSPYSAYSVWKNHNWGNWTNAAVTSVGAPSIVFLADRIRIYMSANYVALSNQLPSRLSYSDSMDNFATWTTNIIVGGAQQTIAGKQMYLRSASVMPVVTTNDVQATLAARLTTMQTFKDLTVEHTLNFSSGTINAASGTLTMNNNTSVSNLFVVSKGTVNGPIGLSNSVTYGFITLTNNFTFPSVMNGVQALSQTSPPVYFIDASQQNITLSFWNAAGAGNARGQQILILNDLRHANTTNTTSLTRASTQFNDQSSIVLTGKTWTAAIATAMSNATFNVEIIWNGANPYNLTNNQSSVTLNGGPVVGTIGGGSNAAAGVNSIDGAGALWSGTNLPIQATWFLTNDTFAAGTILTNTWGRAVEYLWSIRETAGATTTAMGCMTQVFINATTVTALIDPICSSADKGVISSVTNFVGWFPVNAGDGVGLVDKSDAGASVTGLRVIVKGIK